MSKYLEVKLEQINWSKSKGWYIKTYQGLKPDYYFIFHSGLVIRYDAEENEFHYRKYLDKVCHPLTREEFKTEIILRKSKVWRALYE